MEAGVSFNEKAGEEGKALAELIFVTTTQPAVVYFFQSGVLSSIENA